MEKVYYEQRPGFENKDFPTHVNKLNKALNVLNKQPELGTIDLVNFLVIVVLT